MFCPICEGIMTSGGKCFHGKLKYKSLNEVDKISSINLLQSAGHTLATIAAHHGITTNDIRRMRDARRRAGVDSVSVQSREHAATV